MSQTAYATAADYADALLTARRAKNFLFFVLFVCLVGQLTLFIVTRTTGLIVTPTGATVSARATTEPVAALPPVETGAPTDMTTMAGPDHVTTTQLVTTGPARYESTKTGQLLQYLNGLCAYVGLASNLVLGVVLLLIVAIMLVGRLVGVARVTSAFIWTAALLVLIFPWQAFLNNSGLTGVEFKIPGVLYTWNELVNFANFKNEVSRDAILNWARFVGFPVVALVILLMIQAKSARGLKQALGETSVSTGTIA